MLLHTASPSNVRSFLKVKKGVISVGYLISVPFSTVFASMPEISIPSGILLSGLSESSHPNPTTMPNSSKAILNNDCKIVVFIRFRIYVNKRELLFGKLKKVPSRLNDLHCVTCCHEFVCAFVAFCCHTVYILFGIKLLFFIGMNRLNDNVFIMLCNIIRTSSPAPVHTPCGCAIPADKGCWHGCRDVW